ncbi:hypothetical protein [Paenibacillus sp. NPDC057934]|uniref:hypothetical protein n=1 Tax=Paenibacillus sp. NPDC057934 TaxID=3346282 RepID=UPI0036D92EE9
MFDVISVYNIVSATYWGLDWEEEEKFQEVYDEYSKLSFTERSTFDSLVNQAISSYKGLFESFPETHLTQTDMDIREEIQGEITNKLALMFQSFL